MRSGGAARRPTSTAHTRHRRLALRCRFHGRAGRPARGLRRLEHATLRLVDFHAMPEKLEITRDIAASPEAVYAAISDVTRMGEWSTECHTCAWQEGFDRSEEHTSELQSLTSHSY